MFLEILQNSQENKNLYSNKVALEQVLSYDFAEFLKAHFLKTPPGDFFRNYLQKQTLKKLIVLLKLCKENHPVQPKMLDVSFSIEFRFETK